MQSRRHEEFRGLSPRYDLGSDPYLSSRRENPNPNRSSRPRRSLSPQDLLDRRGILIGDRRSGSIERREYSWHLRGGRAEKEKLGSPIYEQMRKRPHLDEEIVRKNYEFCRPVNHESDVYRYDHSGSRMESIDRRGMLGPKMDDETARGLHRLPLDIGPPAPNYGQTGRRLASAGMSENGKPHYWNPISAQASTSHFMGSYQGGVTLPYSDEHANSSGRITETLDVDQYRQRYVVDYARDPEAGRRNMRIYRRNAYSPTRNEHHDYDQIRADFDHRRSSIMHPAVDRVGNVMDSSENLRKRCTWEHPSLQNQTVLDNLDMRRTASNTLDQGGMYLGSHIEYERRVSDDYEMFQKGISRDSQISRLRSDHGFRRDTDPRNHRERSSEIPSMPGRELDINRGSIIARRMKEEQLHMYEAEDKGLKRKYMLEEGIRAHNSRSNMSSKFDPTRRDFQDQYNSDEEWIDNDKGNFYPSRTARFDYTDYGEAERTNEEEDVSDDLLELEYPLEHSEGHSVKFYKSGSRFVKGHQRQGSLSSSHHLPRKSGFSHKQRKIWTRNVDYHDDDQANDGDFEEDWESSVRTEPAEGSEEFNQLVHEAFLKYSKKLNMNSSVRKRYKEQGKAGSLFCVVCGRSMSKEFMDTRRLATHAFMSHKVGLRTRHLGLHKAICVLLGWNSVATLETITGPPEVLPDAEVLAHKEDLIMWPPVVFIHNISILNLEKESKIITIEALETFLRGKGFSGGRICLGKPADRSVMVVKFLGTFSGLENAEKIHKYFSDNNHGRLDFELAASKKGNGRGGRMREDESEELILYGYLGISEAVDKLDFNTKRFTLIKSKKEILDLANAPVKPDDR